MQSRRTTAPVRFGLVAALVTALTGFALAAPAQAKQEPKRELTVMTQNLYLGSDLTPAIAATTPEQFLYAVAAIYSNVQYTNFPSRAGAIAATVAAERPDLIGLQEVAQWTLKDLNATPPTVSELDFLVVLEGALTSQGLHYAVAAMSENATIGPVPLLSPCAGPLGSCLLTFHDRDVILVNQDTPGLRVFNPQSGQYVAQAVVPTVGGPQSFDRGWASVDGTFQGKKFHYVNTHLETEDFPAVQEAQAKEFLAGPAKAGGAVIATGDFNSAADGSTTASYATLTKSYFDDAWWTNPGVPGLSCCHDGLLANPAKAFTSRIDLVLTHAAVRAVSAHVIGLDPIAVTPPLWESDHAGVVATVRLH